MNRIFFIDRKIALIILAAFRSKATKDRIEEVGGGLNFKRKKFLQIIQWAIQGELKFLYIAHKDRLCCFSRLYGLRKYKEKFYKADEDNK